MTDHPVRCTPEWLYDFLRIIGRLNGLEAAKLMADTRFYELLDAPCIRALTTAGASRAEVAAAFVDVLQNLIEKIRDTTERHVAEAALAATPEHFGKSVTKRAASLPMSPDTFTVWRKKAVYGLVFALLREGETPSSADGP